MMKFVLFAAAMLLAGCSKSPQAAEPAITSATDAAVTTAAPAPAATSIYDDKGKQYAWIEKGQDAIKAKLRDPDSAKFRNVEFHAGGGVPIVCGEVNSNNGFGGKAGFERFIAAGDKIDVLESEMSSSADMDGVWDKFCRA